MKYTKYPRTKHLPWSGSATHDDRFLDSTECFHNQQVVVTLKLDGESTSLYSDGSFHARSLDSQADPSRDWLHKWWGGVCYTPESQYVFEGIYNQYDNLEGDLRFCGENLRAKHTLEYTNLESYFYLHSIWLGDYCLHWEDTVNITDELSLSMAPMLYHGLYNEKAIREFDSLEVYDGMPVEGYVVRLASSILLKDFGSSVAKYVRPDFHIGQQHWFHSQREYNRLKDGSKNNS